ncbi:rifin PIR protein, putative [Plasmodium reichenowi]|uniref:Rifin PIR protein, putative n=1 Tax=Plasmodium reichenowi TaxID=5854 RepID=A0A2P9D3X7_PLARE|nr:rifin PIR protein, putative [Plasmodium reichenowi]
MKVHYINILLFALPLNILVNTHNKNSSITNHTYTNRSLCECELYAPANYDSDPQMKEVIDNFNKQTQQRFEEYDERMQSKRKHCKDKCDKEIQKIILKDKLEKELMDKFATLQTDIQNDAIPTCVCEKSMAGKTETFCLNCGLGIGGGVTLSSGVLGGIGAVAANAWQTAALITAKELAEKAGAAAGKDALIPATIKGVIEGLEGLGIYKVGNKPLKSLIFPQNYADFSTIKNIITTKKTEFCSVSLANDANDAMCTQFKISLRIVKPDGRNPLLPDNDAIRQTVTEILAGAEEAAAEAADAATKEVTKAAIKKSTEAIGATGYNWYTTIYYSITAILIIVLIMVIIYLILRYRRKKKMKKKLKYIKLLEE